VRCQNCSIPVDTLPVCREYQDRQVLIFPMPPLWFAQAGLRISALCYPQLRVG
jgi:hypothetical protein